MTVSVFPHPTEKFICSFRCDPDSTYNGRKGFLFGKSLQKSRGKLKRDNEKLQKTVEKLRTNIERLNSDQDNDTRSLQAENEMLVNAKEHYKKH